MYSGKPHNSAHRGNRGVTVILVLVFMGVFTIIMGTVASYTLTQSKVARAKLAQEEAFAIAEAGLEYYRWFLAHNPGDLQNGTGAAGPYMYTVDDPEGDTLGTATLSISGNEACGETQQIDITSEGVSNTDPQFSRTLSSRYARPSVAQFSYIINGNVWVGGDRTISGPYHSNGGIRMDGTSNADVTSSVADWLCTSSFGCSPDQTVDGVWGSGVDPALWDYPVPQVDFAGIVVDMTELKDHALADGLHFTGAAGRSGRKGYRLNFLADGTVDVYRVINTSYNWSIHVDDINGGWKQDYHTITQENFIDNYTIPDGCPVIFVEDKIWIEGTVKGKITVASADFLGSSFETDVIINDSIDYAGPEGDDGLTVIAENSILIPPEVPTDMSLRGIFVAQGGYFGRNLYACWDAPYDKRNTLTINGTIVSNERVGTKWTYSTSGCSNEWSGFETRINAYDRLLATDPPAFTPAASENHTFTTWREE